MAKADRLIEIFNEARAQPPGAERERLLDLLCQNDSELKEQVVALLGSEARAGAFLNPTLSAPTIQVSETLGQSIGRYKLLEKIGEGGCGVVYVAEQTEPVRRRVALKIIKLGMDTKAVVARFEAERQAVAMMDHPNIAKVLDAGTTETGRAYFVMELVRGTRITDYCDQHSLSTEARLDLFIQVCHAIQHAHQKGIIHRDIKPSNILVTLQEPDRVGSPKVIDFGIAKAIEGRLTDATVYTQLHQFIGTPAYMSPEQAGMSDQDIDTRSDIYALGVLLYELLTGKPPFDGQRLLASGIDAMRKTIRETEPVRPSTQLTQDLAAAALVRAEPVPGLSIPSEAEVLAASRRRLRLKEQINRVRGDLDWIVMKCLEKERGRRYETANSLAMDVRRHLAAEPVIARPPNAAYHLQRLVVRNKFTFAAIGAVAIALVVGLTAATLGWRAAWVESDNAVRARQAAETARLGEAAQRQQAEQARVEENHQRQRAEYNLYAAEINLAARDLSVANRGHALELLSNYRPGAGAAELRGWEWRYLWQRCQTKEQFTLTGHPGRVGGLIFFPDGNRLVAAGGIDGVVMTWDLDSRKEVGRFSLGRTINGLALSPDGKALVIGWPDGVAIYDALSFAKIRQLPGAQGPPALSPDGRTLVTGGTNGPVVWDGATLKELHRSNGRQGVIPPRTEISFSPDGGMVAIPTAWPDGRFEIKVWDAAGLRQKGFEQSPISTLQRDGKEFHSVCALVFSTDAQILGTGPELQLWDPKTGLPLTQVKSGVDVLNMRFLPDGKTLLTFGWEQDFRLWDISARTNIAFLRVLPGHENEIWSMAIAPDGRRTASGSKDGIIKVWKMEAFQEQPKVNDRIDAPNIAEAGFAQDGRTLASISLDSALGSWDTETLQPRAFGHLPRRFIAALFSPQGTDLALGLTNGAVEVWQRLGPNNSPQLSRELLPPQPKSFQPYFITLKKDWELSPASPLMTWSGNGKKLAAVVNELYVWDTAAGQLDSKLLLPGKPDAIALSPDGSILAAGSRQNIQMWDVKSSQPLPACVGHREWIVELAFSPDGKTLASVSFDNTAALWDVATGRLRSRLTTHSSPATHLAFSPDGRTLATRGLDNTVRLWHVQTGRELMALEAPLADWGPQFRAVRFTPDGTTMAVGLSSSEIQFFRAPSIAEIDAGEARQAGKQ